MNRLQRKLTSRPGPVSSQKDESVRASQSRVLSRALTSHLGVLIVFPGLVLGLGTYLTVTAQKALRKSNLELAETRLADQAALVSDHVSAALAKADLQLESLASLAKHLDSSTPPAEVAIPLKHLLQGHSGASYISLSFPDGTFEGAFVDRDSTIRFRKSRVQEDHTSEQLYEYKPDNTLELVEERRTQYDPRKRPFYELALASPGRVWTRPYPFADTHDTGITRTEALRQDDHVMVVLTFDYDVRRLSPLLKRNGSYVGRPILFDKDGTILADPELVLPEARSNQGSQLLTYQLAGDPVLTSFFTSPLAKGGSGSFTTPEGTHMAAIAKLHGEGRPDWTIAFLAPEATFLGSLESYGRRSLLSASLALLLSTLLSAGFARLIVRARKETAEAREAARRARLEARELGSYRLVERLGVGGMGEVWRAEHRFLARDAAIKIIKTDDRPELADIALERFQREAQSLASLRCRNTIEIYDYGVADDGTFFYVMELLDGIDLNVLVERFGPQDPYRAVRILIQACSSLAEAHEAGLVHRDIKPANIFLCRAADDLDIVKVLDFGLVRSDGTREPESAPEPASGEDSALHSGERAVLSTHKLTEPNRLLGTPAFIAPEQALGSEVDARTDLYALGCVAFWLLTGRTVFGGASTRAQVFAHLTDPAPSLDSICKTTLPTRLVNIVGACLAKSPSERPKGARALRAELESILHELDPAWETEKATWWSVHLNKTLSDAPRHPTDQPPTELLSKTRSSKAPLVG